MLKIDFNGMRVLDVGCGTSILSILSEKLGSDYILAIDNDDWAVANSLENAEINKCYHIIVEKAEINAIDQKIFNVILANINRNVILKDMSTYVDLLAADGSLLLSGFHLLDVPMIMDLAEKLGMKKTTMLNQKEWCMLHLMRSI
jgi:ribosomal protein L11 methyltransferase